MPLWNCQASEALEILDQNIRFFQIFPLRTFFVFDFQIQNLSNLSNFRNPVLKLISTFKWKVNFFEFLNAYLTCIQCIPYSVNIVNTWYSISGILYLYIIQVRMHTFDNLKNFTKKTVLFRLISEMVSWSKLWLIFDWNWKQGKWLMVKIPCLIRGDGHQIFWYFII